MKKRLRDVTLGECADICKKHDCDYCPLKDVPCCIWTELPIEEFDVEVEVPE